MWGKDCLLSAWGRGENLLRVLCDEKVVRGFTRPKAYLLSMDLLFNN